MAEEKQQTNQKSSEELKKEETKTEEKSVKESFSSSQNQSQDKEIRVPDKFKLIVEAIEKMSVLDLSELVKILEDKFGVSSATPIITGVVPNIVDAGNKQGGAEEKSEFDIELTAIGDKKIDVIKVVRTITEKGLKDAKDLVESAPAIVKEKVKKQEAEEIKKKLEEAGAIVTLK